MRLTYKEAHKVFKRDHPNIKVCVNFFYRLRPKHIKSLNKTPIDACQCVYCTNVNLKLHKLGIPNINTELDLYNQLICVKKGRFRNYKCITRICKTCKNSDKKIEALACNLDMEK